MMNLRAFLLLLPLVTLSVAASEPKRVFDEYSVKINDEMSVPVRLPKDEVLALRKGFIGLAEQIESCKNSKGSLDNPMISRSLSYTVKNGRAGCALSINSWASWEYKCQLPSVERISLAFAIKKRANTDEVLGDYSPEEKSILFDLDLCTPTRLSR